MDYLRLSCDCLVFGPRSVPYVTRKLSPPLPTPGVIRVSPLTLAQWPPERAANNCGHPANLCEPCFGTSPLKLAWVPVRNGGRGTASRVRLVKPRIAIRLSDSVVVVSELNIYPLICFFGTSRGPRLLTCISRCVRKATTLSQVKLSL